MTIQKGPESITGITGAMRCSISYYSFTGISKGAEPSKKSRRLIRAGFAAFVNVYAYCNLQRFKSIFYSTFHHHPTAYFLLKKCRRWEHQRLFQTCEM